MAVTTTDKEDNKQTYINAPKYLCIYKDKDFADGDYIIREVIKNHNHPTDLYQWMAWSSDSCGSGYLIFKNEIIHVEPQSEGGLERLQRDYAQYFI